MSGVKPGPFRRAIALRTIDVGASHGWLEDDFHHFGVRIEHRQGRIIRVHGVVRRAPWSSCAGATHPLRELEGQALRERASEIGAMIDMRRQCTHLFDLAGLVMALAWRGDTARDYLAEVPSRPIAMRDGPPFGVGTTTPILWRDGACVLAWRIDGNKIIGPGDASGQSLNRGFRAWTEAMPVQRAEHALVLRRAIMVATGRGIDLDRFETAAEVPLPPVCHTFAGILDQAKRCKGSTRDFGGKTFDLLRDPDISPLDTSP